MLVVGLPISRLGPSAASASRYSIVLWNVNEVIGGSTRSTVREEETNPIDNSSNDGKAMVSSSFNNVHIYTSTFVSLE